MKINWDAFYISTMTELQSELIISIKSIQIIPSTSFEMIQLWWVGWIANKAETEYRKEVKDSNKVSGH